MSVKYESEGVVVVSGPGGESVAMKHANDRWNVHGPNYELNSSPSRESAIAAAFRFSWSTADGPFTEEFMVMCQEIGLTSPSDEWGGITGVIWRKSQESFRNLIEKKEKAYQSLSDAYKDILSKLDRLFMFGPKHDKYDERVCLTEEGIVGRGEDMRNGIIELAARYKRLKRELELYAETVGTDSTAGIRSDGSIELCQRWQPGGARGNEHQEFIDGDQYVFAVRLSDDTWDIHSVVARVDPETGAAFDNADGDTWGAWDWLDVEWFVPASEFDLPFVP